MKDKIQERAMDMAYEQYNKDFYDLTEAQQTEIYNKAESLVMDEMVDEADTMRKEMAIHEPEKLRKILSR